MLTYIKLIFKNFINQKSFSTKVNNSITPIKSYSNADTMKQQILDENREKSGIYRWVNNINGKTYIGRSINIKRRLFNYYSLKFANKFKMIINKALFKYGHSNFSFEILEYCEAKNIISREQYYLNLLQPEYNILENADNSLGFKHSADTII